MVSKKGFSLLELGGYAGIILYYLGMVFLEEKFHLAAILAGLVILMFIYVFRYPEYHAHQVMAAFFGIVYVGSHAVLRLSGQNAAGRSFPCVADLPLLLGLRYLRLLRGQAFRKAQDGSGSEARKKSVEGAVGGVAGAVLLGVIFAAVTKGPAAEYAGICGAGALISMVGDLAASAVKRNMEIKDYGKLIPGPRRNSGPV